MICQNFSPFVPLSFLDVSVGSVCLCDAADEVSASHLTGKASFRGAVCGACF